MIVSNKDTNGMPFSCTARRVVRANVNTVTLWGFYHLAWHQIDVLARPEFPVIKVIAFMNIIIRALKTEQIWDIKH